MPDTPVQDERLTAWQRWELPAFDGPGAVIPGKLPTAAQLEQMQQMAHEEGYQAGLKKANQEAQRLAGMVGALDKELQRVDQQVTEDLLKLALEIARQMLQQALKVKPELLLGVVQEAIAALPHFNQHAHLMLHPADAELVRAHIGEQLAHTGWKILENAQIERGGCRVETTNSQIDATLATRWQRVVAAIGRDDKWLEP